MLQILSDSSTFPMMWNFFQLNIAQWNVLKNKPQSQKIRRQRQWRFFVTIKINVEYKMSLSLLYTQVDVESESPQEHDAEYRLAADMFHPLDFIPLSWMCEVLKIFLRLIAKNVNEAPTTELLSTKLVNGEKFFRLFSLPPLPTSKLTLY